MADPDTNEPRHVRLAQAHRRLLQTLMRLAVARHAAPLEEEARHPATRGARRDAGAGAPLGNSPDGVGETRCRGRNREEFITRRKEDIAR